MDFISAKELDPKSFQTNDNHWKAETGDPQTNTSFILIQIIKAKTSLDLSFSKVLVLPSNLAQMIVFPRRKIFVNSASKLDKKSFLSLY